MAEPITAAILAYGLPGIITLVLLAALRHVFGLYTTAQEARITEGRESVKAMERGTDALDRLTAVMQAKKEG